MGAEKTAEERADELLKCRAKDAPLEAIKYFKELSSPRTVNRVDGKTALAIYAQEIEGLHCSNSKNEIENMPDGVRINVEMLACGQPVIRSSSEDRIAVDNGDANKEECKRSDPPLTFWNQKITL